MICFNDEGKNCTQCEEKKFVLLIDKKKIINFETCIKICSDRSFSFVFIYTYMHGK